MRRKRSKRDNGKPAKDDLPMLDPSLENLATVLEAIAAMDALPLAPSPRPRKAKRPICRVFPSEGLIRLRNITGFVASGGPGTRVPKTT